MSRDIYYRFLFDDSRDFGVAFAPSTGRVFTLPTVGAVVNWQPIVMELRKGVFTDYLANNIRCRLCSERLKRILTENASSSDILQWLPVEVNNGEECRRYFILHFPSPPDVVDKIASIIVDDFVVKPVLSKSAATGHRVFAYPDGGELKLFVDQRVMSAIVGNGCSGMQLTEAPSR